MRINGTTKAPIVNHLAEAIAGGSTIRAFKKEAEFTVENLCLIDTNASPFFHSFGTIQWLILRLELLSATVLVASALFIVLLPEGHIDPGLCQAIIFFILLTPLYWVRIFKDKGFARRITPLLPCVSLNEI